MYGPYEGLCARCLLHPDNKEAKEEADRLLRESVRAVKESNMSEERMVGVKDVPLEVWEKVREKWAGILEAQGKGVDQWSPDWHGPCALCKFLEKTHPRGVFCLRCCAYSKCSSKDFRLATKDPLDDDYDHAETLAATKRILAWVDEQIGHVKTEE
jgi:hypothetical protein